jgi:general secretion pathway protein F
MPGRIGEIATLLGTRMSRGETLPEIMASDRRLFPPVWRAVVEAGLRSGNLAAALEGMATTGRRLSELRRVTAMAMIYPLIVVTLAYVLFVFLVTQLAPVTLAAFEDLSSSSDAFLSSLVWLGESARWWSIWVPAAVVLLLGAWWYRSGRAMGSFNAVVGGPARQSRPGRATLFRRSLRDGRMATFAELLSLLIEQQVPPHEAVVLAANATGDRSLSEAAEKIAERLRRGEALGDQDPSQQPFPPLLSWLISVGTGRSGFCKTLRMTAETYRQRALRAVSWRALYFPILLTAIVGGGATLAQALAVFLPISRLLYELGMP